MDKQPKQPEASWRFRCGCDRQLHTQITAREGRLLRTELDCMMQEADEFCAENEPTGKNGARTVYELLRTTRGGDREDRGCYTECNHYEPWRYAAPSNLLGNRVERAKCLKNALSMLPWPYGIVCE